MKPLGQHLRLVLDESAQRERLERELAGRTVHEHLRTRLPLVSALLPSDITPAAYAPCSGAAAYIETRLQECARCPKTGGACDASPVDHLIGKGKVATWKNGAFGSADCGERWPEYMLRMRLRRSGVGDRLLGCRLETFEDKTAAQMAAVITVRRYIETFPPLVRWGEEETIVETAPRGLKLASEGFGVGKTHLAVAIVAALYRAEKIRSARFEFVPDFLERVRRAMDDYDRFGSTIVQAIKADVLVLDDLGAHKTSEWVREQLLVIANARWERNRPTIVTTNGHMDACRETLGPRADSRLSAESDLIIVDGEDRRR